ncbi:MAG: hypothetical protein ACI9G1_005660 [Pirellulaceae bacterium]|jgi:hypothetical protein
MSTLKLSGGTLVLSIDLDGGGESGPSRSAVAVASQLNKVLDHFELPATWLSSEPAKLSHVLTASRVQHEAGLLGNESWIGRSAGRTTFARELHCRLDRAERAGVEVSTLGLKNTKLDQHLDLLVKHRITVVRSPLETGSAGFVRPHALRFGVWEAPPTLSLPASHLWLPAAVFSARWTVGRAAANGALVHIALDLNKLDESCLKPLERLFSYSRRLRDDGMLKFDTVGALAERFQRRRANPPMHSVLRAA